MLRLLDYVGLGDLVKGRFRIGQENSPWFEKKSKIGHGGFWFSKKNQKNPFLLITKTFLKIWDTLGSLENFCRSLSNRLGQDRELPEVGGGALRSI